MAYGLMWTIQSVDYIQTQEILTNDNFREMNNVINDTNLGGYIIISNAVILVVAHFLSDDYRKMLFSGKAGINVANAWHNYEQGVSP